MPLAVNSRLMKDLLRHIITRPGVGALLIQAACFCQDARAQDLSLVSFLDQVAQANPSISASELRARALEHRIKPSSTLEDPFIAIGPDEIPFSEEMGSVTRFQLSQTLPFPGKLSARGGIAEGRAKAARAEAQTNRRQIHVIAVQTFYRAYFNQEALHLNERLQRILEDTVQSAKTRYKTGDTGHHDWLLARVELSVLEVEKLKLERERRSLHAFLNELRNESPERRITRVTLDLNGTKSEPAIPEPLLSDSPELGSLDAFIRSAEEEQRLAKLSYFPDFVVQGMAMTPNSPMAEPANWGIMVGISLPIFFWRKQSETLRAARFDLEAASLEKRSLENRLRTEIVDAKQQLKTAYDILDLYQESVIPNTKLAVNNARSGYAARRLPLSQFLETLKTQRTLELELLAARLDSEAAKLRLKELLSSPPILRLAPSRPSLFGAGAMGSAGDSMSSMGASDTVRMGSGMSGPTRKQSKPESPDASDAGMGGM